MNNYDYSESFIGGNSIEASWFNSPSLGDETLGKSGKYRVNLAAKASLVVGLGVFTSFSNAHLANKDEYSKRLYIKADGYEATYTTRSLQAELEPESIDVDNSLWGSRVIKLLDEGYEDQALREISSVSTKLKSSRSEAAMAKGMGEIFENENIPEIILVALLRNTHTFREKIAFWDKFYEITERRLILNGKKPKRILRGLKSNPNPA